MRRLTRPRRLGLAIVSCALATLLFRGTVASALVTRGDDLLRAGDLDGAGRAYQHAIGIDGRSALAADRLAFALLMRRRTGDARRAAAIAERALREAPGDPALLADRAFAEQRLARFSDAARDFVAAARAGRDPRYAHLAARMAERAHDPRTARADLRLALALDARYQPARVLLRRLR